MSVATVPNGAPSALMKNSVFGGGVVFSSAMVYVKNSITVDGQTAKQEFSEMITGVRSGDFETSVRAVAKYGRGQTANVVTMWAGAGGAFLKGGLAGAAKGGAFLKGGLTSLGSFGALIAGGMVGGVGGFLLGQPLGDWLAERQGWNKVTTESDKPACKGDVIAHQKKDCGLWGLVGGVILGAIAVGVGISTFGLGFFAAGLAGLLGGLVGGLIMGAGHTMSQYGEIKGTITGDCSPNVTFEGKPVARVGDEVTCDDHSHKEFIAEGVKTVTVNGRLLARVGCRTTCDGNIAGGCSSITASKETATDGKYPIRESTSLYAEVSATAAMYFPWNKLVGKVKGWFAGTNADTGVPLTQEQINEILAKPKGQRPDPNTYLPPEYIKQHLAKFDDGGVRFVTKSNYEKYGLAQRDGTSFILSKNEADLMWKNNNGDLRAIEVELGLPENFLSNEVLRVDIKNPRQFGLRIPSGNEAGANDMWIPGGKLPTGKSEAIIDINGNMGENLRIGGLNE